MSEPPSKVAFGPHAAGLWEIVGMCTGCSNFPAGPRKLPQLLSYILLLNPFAERNPHAQLDC